MQATPLPGPTLSDLYADSHRHRQEHGCLGYPFEDGAGLKRLVEMLRPRRILELGTAIGHTACCMAQAWAHAQVDTVDADALHVRLARANIEARGLSARVTVHAGAFADVLATLQPGYEVVFFDGFAPGVAVVRQLRTLMAAGGLLVCANLGLLHGVQAQQLAREFADRARWQPRPGLEGGTTLVLCKVA